MNEQWSCVLCVRKVNPQPLSLRSKFECEKTRSHKGLFANTHEHIQCQCSQSHNVNFTHTFRVTGTLIRAQCQFVVNLSTRADHDHSTSCRPHSPATNNTRNENNKADETSVEKRTVAEVVDGVHAHASIRRLPANDKQTIDEQHRTVKRSAHVGGGHNGRADRQRVLLALGHDRLQTHEKQSVNNNQTSQDQQANTPHERPCRLQCRGCRPWR